MNASLIEHFDLLATAPGGVARLRELILTLAVQGKLVPQDPADEPASVLLQRIRAEKDRLIAEGRIKRDKPLAPIADEEMPFGLPEGWEWIRMGTLVNSSEAGWSPNCLSTPRRTGHWGVLKVSAVSWGAFDPDANKELPASLQPRPEYEVKDGDFLLSRANTEELVARSVVVGVAEPLLLLSDKIIRLDVSSQVNRAFLNLCNNCSHARIHYRKHASGTSSSMKNVSREVVLDLPVALPPLVEQTCIVACVEELMRLCDDLEAKGKLDAVQHTLLLRTLLDTLTDSASPAELAANWQRVAEHFDLLLDRPSGLDALEQTILQLAVRGLLVPQDPNDEPASVLLQKIRTEKDRLIAEGKIKRDKPLAPISDEEKPFELPTGWEWVRLPDIYYSISPSGSKLLSSAVQAEGDYPVVDQGKRYVAGYTSDGALLIDIPGPVIVFGDHTKEVKYIDFNFVAGADGTKILRPVQQDERFFAWQLRSFSLEDRGYARHFKVLNSSPFALPPRAEQSRIVARVEELRQLCADLRQRLTASRITQGQLAEALVSAAVSPEAS